MRRKDDKYKVPEPHTNEYMLMQFLKLAWPHFYTVRKDYRYNGGIHYEFPLDVGLGGEHLMGFGELLNEANIGNEFHITCDKEKLLFVFNLKKNHDLHDIKTTTIKHRLARKEPIGDMEFVTHG